MDFFLSFPLGDDDDGPEAKRAKSDSPATGTPPGTSAGAPGMAPGGQPYG